MWLGTHDDLADPDNADPVLRESSRLKAPEKQPYLENIDALGLMDAGDAPIYAYNDSNLFAGNLVNLFLHHALHVLALYDKAQEVGLENVMYAIDPEPEYSLTDPSGENHISFLKRHIQ